MCVLREFQGVRESVLVVVGNPTVRGGISSTLAGGIPPSDPCINDPKETFGFADAGTSASRDYGNSAGAITNGVVALANLGSTTFSNDPAPPPGGGAKVRQ